MALGADLRRRFLRRPVRLVPLAFLTGIVLGTGLLWLPAATRGPGGAPLFAAFFTATSAITTCGLVVVPTAGYWSAYGQVVITVLTQVGGFGVMSLTTLLVLVTSQRLGLGNRLAIRAEYSGLRIGDVRRLLVRIALVALACEAVVTVVMAGRLWLGYHYPAGRATWYGLFHAVQAFNNTGFSLWPDALRGFASDAWMCVPPTLGVIAGATGFPVVFELARRWRRPSTWSVHTRLTVLGSAVLLAVGFLTVLADEWNDPETLGPLGVPGKLVAAFVQGTVPRSGGLQSEDYARMGDETVAVVIALMFIGGGSASTAGGIKVTTFFLLAYVIAAEIRGEPDVVIGGRRIAAATQRLALTVALLGVAAVAGGTLLLMAVTDNVRLYQAIFEVTSAFATAGPTIGITTSLPLTGQALLALLMFVGRVGTVGTVTALTLNNRPRRYRYPEERALVG